MVTQRTKNPRVLIVTPEVTYLPQGMGNIANYFSAKAGGLADVSASLISKLFSLGADVHVVLPDYRGIFNSNIGPLGQIYEKELATYRKYLPEERLHLAEDRAFYYVHSVYSNVPAENLKISLAFQREIINNVLGRVKPDLIHCNDWMTGLIPGYSRRIHIPCLFTIHNIHTVKAPLSIIEDRGIDAAGFWQNLFYENMAGTYEETREGNLVDFLVSGVFGAHFVNTVSPTFLDEIVSGKHAFISPPLRRELVSKVEAGVAEGILNAPDPSYDPGTDPDIYVNYTPEDHYEKKRENKRLLQKHLGLIEDKDAPVFFWPSRLDPIQKGCQLLADILYHVVSRYWAQRLQVVFVSGGVFKQHFDSIRDYHGLEKRIAVHDFNEALSRKAYAAADFILMPSSFEPCGLTQMIAPRYGALPVAHDTGGIHDTVAHMDVGRNTGNGFLFEVFDANGLFWAVDQAIAFYNLAPEEKIPQVGRVMRESAASFTHEVTARRYIELYEKMLQRPLISNL
ncbi:MAG: glycogen/starch synthase [Desulfosalsimonadaceae bacterium]